MSILNWFKKKTIAPFVVEEDLETLKAEQAAFRAEERRIKLDEVRELSKQRILLSKLETREKELEMQIRLTDLEQQLADLTGDEEEYDESDNVENTLFSNIIKLAASKMSSSPVESQNFSHTSIPTAQNSTGDFYTDEKIKEEIDKLNPVQLQMAKKLSDDALRTQLISIDKNMSNDAIKRTIAQIRAR